MLFYIFGEISIPNSYTAIIFIWNKIKTLLTSKQWKIIRTNIFFFKIDRLKLQRYQIIENKFEFQFRQNFCLFYTVLFIQGLIHMVSVYSGFSLHSTVYSRIVFTWFLFTQSLAYIDLLLKRLWEWLCHLQWKVIYGGFRVIMINTTFHNISVISWWSVLLVEETKVPRENHRPVASHWQTLSHNVVSSTPRHEQSSNSQL